MLTSVWPSVSVHPDLLKVCLSWRCPCPQSLQPPLLHDRARVHSGGHGSALWRVSPAAPPGALPGPADLCQPIRSVPEPAEVLWGQRQGPTICSCHRWWDRDRQTPCPGVPPEDGSSLQRTGPDCGPVSFSSTIAASGQRSEVRVDVCLCPAVCCWTSIWVRPCPLMRRSQPWTSVCCLWSSFLSPGESGLLHITGF